MFYSISCSFRSLLVSLVIVVWLLCTLFFTTTNKTLSYFQPQFECSFSGSVLNITSAPHQWSKNCLQLISSMRAKKQDVIKQIIVLSDSSSYNSSYNQSVKPLLIKQRNDLDALITKSIEGVTNLEAKLFVNYKKKYYTKLKSIRTKLVTKQSVLTIDLIGAISDWQYMLTNQIIKTIWLNYQRIKLIECILTSKSLDDMIPLLDTYEQIITSQLSWNVP